jgi:hypothetical protein
MSVFGPALLICSLALGWPAFELATARYIGTSRDGVAQWVTRVSALLRDLGLPYLALMLGTVAARDMGMLGHTPLDWVLGVLLASATGMLGWGLRRTQAWPEATQAALDEVRWCLYRGLGWGWSGSLMIGVLVGFGASLVERVQVRAIETGSLRTVRDDVPWLVRSLTSAILFGVAHNLWLNVLARLAVPAGLSLGRVWRGHPIDTPRG